MVQLYRLIPLVNSFVHCWCGNVLHWRWRWLAFIVMAWRCQVGSYFAASALGLPYLVFRAWPYKVVGLEQSYHRVIGHDLQVGADAYTVMLSFINLRFPKREAKQPIWKFLAIVKSNQTGQLFDWWLLPFILRWFLHASVLSNLWNTHVWTLVHLLRSFLWPHTIHSHTCIPTVSWCVGPTFSPAHHSSI